MRSVFKLGVVVLAVVVYALLLRVRTTEYACTVAGPWWWQSRSFGLSVDEPPLLGRRVIRLVTADGALYLKNTHTDRDVLLARHRLIDPDAPGETREFHIGLDRRSGEIAVTFARNPTRREAANSLYDRELAILEPGRTETGTCTVTARK